MGNTNEPASIEAWDLTPRNAELSIEDPPGESPHTYVDNEETLVQMAKELAAVSHVAVDVEHHHVHSFSGETCLVQFSHRARDWLVDVRVLRDKELQPKSNSFVTLALSAFHLYFWTSHNPDPNPNPNPNPP